MEGSGPPFFLGVAWGGSAGNQRFIAVGFGGIATSADGTNWVSSSFSSGSSNSEYNSIAWGASAFVAVAPYCYNNNNNNNPNGDSLCVARSADDGNSWSEFTVNPNNAPTNNNGGSFGSSVGQRITYGGGLFAALGVKNVFTSPDGATWTPRFLLGSFNSNTNGNYISDGAAILWANGKFVATTQSYSGTGNSNDEVATSTDGISWSSSISSQLVATAALAYGAGKFIAISPFGGGVFSSPDGVAWTPITWTVPPTSLGWFSATWGGPAGNEKFVMVGFGQTDDVATSSDGVTWTATTSEPLAASGGYAQRLSITWGGPDGQKKFVSVGSSVIT